MITTWAVGGHSLGGVVAAGYAGDHAETITGLLLYASYPNTDVSGDTNLHVESISGRNDGLTTAAVVARTRVLLPADTEVTVIDGGVHAFFGDYGEQPGDGQRPSAGSSHLPRSLPPLRLSSNGWRAPGLGDRPISGGRQPAR